MIYYLQSRGVMSLGNPQWYITFQGSPGSGPASATGGLAFGGVTISGTAAQDYTSTGALAFGGVEIAGTAEQRFISTSALTFTNLAIAGTGVQTFTGTGALTFANLAIAGTGSQDYASTGALIFTILAMAGTGTAPSIGAIFVTKNIMRAITQGITETIVLPLQS